MTPEQIQAVIKETQQLKLRQVSAALHTCQQASVCTFRRSLQAVPRPIAWPESDRKWQRDAAVWTGAGDPGPSGGPRLHPRTLHLRHSQGRGAHPHGPRHRAGAVHRRQLLLHQLPARAWRPHREVAASTAGPPWTLVACSASERAGWRPLQAVQVLRHDLFTNDVLYLEVALDLRPLPAQLLPLLPLFCRWPPGLRPLVSVRRCSLARALGAVIDLLPAADAAAVSFTPVGAVAWVSSRHCSAGLRLRRFRYHGRACAGRPYTASTSTAPDLQCSSAIGAPSVCAACAWGRPQVSEVLQAARPCAPLPRALLPWLQSADPDGHGEGELHRADGAHRAQDGRPERVPLHHQRQGQPRPRRLSHGAPPPGAASQRFPLQSLLRRVWVGLAEYAGMAAARGLSCWCLPSGEGEGRLPECRCVARPWQTRPAICWTCSGTCS